MTFTITAAEAADQAKGYPEIVADNYKVQCTTNSKNDVSNNGKDMIVLELEIISNDKGDVKLKGQKVWHRIVDGEHMKSFLVQALAGFGIPITGTMQVGPELFMGKTATIKVIKNGEYANVKSFLPKETSETPTFNEPEEDPFA